MEYTILSVEFLVSREGETAETILASCSGYVCIMRGLAIKFPDWYEKINKKYKRIKNCFISFQSNLRLFEYMCWIDLKVFENSR
jgi:hypothetical protein